MYLKKRAGAAGPYVKGVYHMLKYDHHLSSVHRYGLPIDHNIARPIRHQTNLQVLVAMRAKVITGPQGAGQRVIDHILVLVIKLLDNGFHSGHSSPFPLYENTAACLLFVSSLTIFS